MRGTTALLVAIGLLALVAVVADLVLTDVAEAQTAARVSEELGASAAVDLQGWPVSLRLLGGTVPRVGITADDVPVEDTAIRLSRLEVDVTDVRLRLADLLADGPLPVDGGSGTFRATLSQAEVNRLAGLGDVQLGEGVASLVVLGQQIDAVATVEDARIVLRPLTDLPGLGPVPLAPVELPGEVVLDAVRIRPGELELTGRVLRLQR
jgi:hypothetical protein